jgi:hypothetical protein
MFYVRSSGPPGGSRRDPPGVPFNLSSNSLRCVELSARSLAGLSHCQPSCRKRVCLTFAMSAAAPLFNVDCLCGAFAFSEGEVLSALATHLEYIAAGSSGGALSGRPSAVRVAASKALHACLYEELSMLNEVPSMFSAAPRAFSRLGLLQDLNARGAAAFVGRADGPCSDAFADLLRAVGSREGLVRWMTDVVESIAQDRPVVLGEVLRASCILRSAMRNAVDLRITRDCLDQVDLSLVRRPRLRCVLTFIVVVIRPSRDPWAAECLRTRMCCTSAPAFACRKTLLTERC